MDGYYREREESVMARYYDDLNQRSKRKEIIEDPAMSPVERETTETITQTKGVTADLVKLREEPTYDAGVITALYKGQEVEIMDTHRDFYHVKVVGSGTTGYIASKFCKVV